MDSVNSNLQAIVKNNGGTPKDWRGLAALINSRPDEYLKIFMNFIYFFRVRSFINEFRQMIREVPPPLQIIALDLMDFLMVECGLPLHTQVSSKDFVTFLLTLLKTKDSPEVQFKILTLIKKWGIRFENKRDILPNFYETYNSLKNSKVVFPENLDSTYHQYLREERNNLDSSGPKSNNNNMDFPNFSNLSISDNSKNYNQGVQGSSQSQSQKPVQTQSSSSQQNVKLENNYGNVCLDLNPDNYPKKYKKFVSELVTLLNYITLANVS